ncbi:hypothetical protein RHS04_03891 [Rhizoctonia solani]|uniref:Uncharacterized protein n=1 Tax=Rhizoctonia solani TaxID=456999 RepID=A0A8H7M5I9_9AGAM|nr:hypothetical protein RHS04_03891 [Rhizoctonia solani]KAF8760771.1 hypothetical protein RHS01_00242 [Rhizoctonia solani]
MTLLSAVMAAEVASVVDFHALHDDGLAGRITSIGHVPPSALVFGALAIGSFYHTWYYMIKFLEWSFHDFESRQLILEKSLLDRVTQWLMGTDLFEQAWRHVCEGPLNWWWSQQLCILTVGVWTTFLFAQGSQRRIPFVWAYMLLGQLVAISVATNIFFAAVILYDDLPSERKSKSRPPSRTTQVPAGVYLPIFLSHLTILLSPSVAQPDCKWFLPNLLTMHLLIVLPLFNVRYRPVTENRSSLSLGTFYIVLAALAFIPRAQTYLSLPYQDLSSLVPQLLETLYSHPAQGSIGFDVVWTTASFTLYCAVAGGLGLGLLGLVSPGLALYLDTDHH